MPNRNKRTLFEILLNNIETTWGNVVDNGSHVDKAKTPPSVWGEVNAKRK